MRARLPSAALVTAVALSLSSAAATQASEADGKAKGPDVGEIGAKLSNPVSDVWALFTEIDLDFSDGDVNLGDPKVGSRMIFQPVLPFPLYGSGENEWKLITRPIIPILFSQPVPTGLDRFDHEAGLADITLPMLVSPSTGRWLLGAGPAWLFPTSTEDAFGRQQWGVGPSAVFGYMNETGVIGVFPQYYFGIGSRGDRPSSVTDASYMNLLYFAVLNLPDAWQVGMNPTITYDHRAPDGNQWNVPIGLFVAKTTKIGKLPTDPGDRPTEKVEIIKATVEYR